MKTFLFLLLCCVGFNRPAFSQKSIVDESIRYQQERMVHKQWDRKKFTPTSGFLSLNPYYWLTWGLHPNYPDTDRRPLSAWGPQTQRLGLAGAMSSASTAYKLESDTLRNTSLMEINNQLAALSATDPLWLLYYSKELRPVLEHSPQNILSALPAAVRGRVIAEGSYSWYVNELEMLKERIDGARTANMDRGSRILAYHRFLMEYKTLSSTWATRTATASANMKNTAVQSQLNAGQVTLPGWSPGSDVDLAKEVVRNRKY
ncbi:hypothetical protein [Pedobacter sp. GR22-6]|uniref:hypothetical protein n=1 Tax=Pedobacter sp. GR22-6 TaxID=3127957 RepID=UPI00307DFD79